MNDEMTPDAETINHLRRLGLNDYESRAYYALAVHGSQTAGGLSETSGVPRARGYDVLDKLQEKGFVSIQHGRPVRFAALPIVEAVKTLKKQREASLVEELQLIDELGKGLQSRIKPSGSTQATPSEEVVWSLKGREAIYSKISSMINESRKNVVISSDDAGLKRKLVVHAKELTKAKGRGVNITLVSPSKIDSEHASIVRSVPTRMVLADDQALLFLSDAKQRPEDELGLWLKSPHIVETVKNALK